MNLRKPRRILPLVLLAALLVMIFAIGAASAAVPPRIAVQILGVNDFHGALEKPATGSNPPGAEYLSTWIKTLEAQEPNTVIVSAGDTIGATPLLSALFHDEPTIEAFNEMGVDVNAVGNHEFDEGWQELKRIQQGGCHPVDGCGDGDPYLGADFQYLAANVFFDGTNKTLFPAYEIKTFKYGVKVAFIGMTLEGTPLIVSPSGVAGLEFKDEADTVNRLIRVLKNRGVETIVVLIHEGGYPSVGGQYNACPGISGPIIDIVERTNDEVDLFITGHTHQAYNCVIDGDVVTSAGNNGLYLTEVDLEISRTSKEVQAITATNHLVTQTVTPDAAITALIAEYNAVAAPLKNRIVGSITADIVRGPNRGVESTVGRLVADAQLDATNDPGTGNAVIAFMNAGGLREDFIYAEISGGEALGEVTFGELFQVQPFGNSLVTMDLTGAQIELALEQQWSTNPNPGLKLLQVSEGFTYAYSASAAAGDKIDPASIMLNGVPIDLNATYRVTVNSFLADGGDGFAAFAQGTNRLGGAVDTDALEAYFAAHSPVAPVNTARITILP